MNTLTAVLTFGLSFALTYGGVELYRWWQRRKARAQLQQLLRDIPELTQVPWGFSFMGTGYEGTETNWTLGPEYRAPPKSPEQRN